MEDGSDHSDVQENEDIWDDTLLIKAYDKAINAAKLNLQNQMDNESNDAKSQSDTKEDKRRGQSHMWRVGMPCRAAYSADGVEYEALIKSIDHDKGKCSVMFIGYENEEEVELSSLMKTNGDKSRRAQEYEASKLEKKKNYTRENIDVTNIPSASQISMIPPPPPIPNIFEGGPVDEHDAFSAMLMSWYMSGYHTGYYQGLKAKSEAKSYRMSPYVNQNGQQ